MCRHTVQLQVFAGVKGIVGRGEVAASKCCGLADYHQCNTFFAPTRRETAKRVFATYLHTARKS